MVRQFQKDYKTNLPQNVADHSRAHDYGDGLLVYQERDDLREAEEGYSSAISEEEVKYDPSVWQSVIRYGPGEQDYHSADNRGYVLRNNILYCYWIFSLRMNTSSDSLDRVIVLLIIFRDEIIKFKLSSYVDVFVVRIKIRFLLLMLTPHRCLFKYCNQNPTTF